MNDVDNSTIWTVCICCLSLLGHAAGATQSAADQPCSLFGTEAAMIGPGGIYPRVVGHKMVLLKADRTEIAGEAIASPNEEFEAALDLAKGTITVRKIDGRGP